MTEEEQRAAVEAEGRTWLRTPYHHNAAVKGAGVDCARILLESFSGAGIIEWFDIGPYNHDWHLHRSEERYLNQVASLMVEMPGSELSIKDRGPDFVPKKADILMLRVGRTYSHGLLVTEWPWVIHSSYPSRMVEEVNVHGSPMAKRPMRHFDYWGPRS